MDIGQDIAVENNELFCLFLSWFSNLRLILVFEPVCVMWHSKIAHFLDFLRPLCGGALALIHFLRSMDKWELERALSNSCDEKKIFLAIIQVFPGNGQKYMIDRASYSGRKRKEGGKDFTFVVFQGLSHKHKIHNPEYNGLSLQ